MFGQIMKVVARLVVLVAVVTSHRLHPLSDEFIDLINSKQSLWEAGRNFHRHTSLKYLKRLAGTIKPNATFEDSLTDEPPRYKNIENLPFEFDARDKWKICPSLEDIRDQGSCGSCWAVSAVSAMSDRLCIQSKGRKSIYFSEYDVMTCCMSCGNACIGGGILEKAWWYAKSVGVVSGGPYGSGKGCKPSKISPCKHINIEDYSDHKPCGHNNLKTLCENTCNNNKPYMRDKRRLAIYYKLSDEKQIMADIYKNGPVTTTFALHEDFFSYKSGVYHKVAGKVVGYHSVKLIGWGEERGATYWLAANSWNTDWGDRGFFKIIRGTNHLGIEQEVYTGLFRVRH